MERIIRKTDVAYKYGCGRFIQKKDLLKDAAKEVFRFGNSAFVIGGQTTLPLVEEQLKESFEREKMRTLFRVYEGPCSHEAAYSYATGDCKDVEVIVGAGGGRIMDLAKLIGEYARKPVVLIPTSSATCAAFAPLSVCYNPDGTTVGTTKFETEVSAVLCDMDILCRQPVRLLLAGAYDAMAKLIELNHRVSSAYDNEEYIGMRFSYLAAEFIYKTISAELPKAERDVKAGICSTETEDVVYLSIVGAGLCSGLVNGSNQCAIAHKIYEFTRLFLYSECKDFLHGELVALGLIAQLYYNGKASEAEEFREKLRDAGFPTCISDLHIVPTKELFDKYYDALCNSSALKGRTEDKKSAAKDALGKIFI